MNATLVTAPTLLPVSVIEAKQHLYVIDNDHDEKINMMLLAATEEVESILGRALLTQTWDYYLQAFPAGRYIKLPFGKLQSVTSVKYKDSDGTETTMTASTEYIVETNSEPGKVVLPSDTTWPSGPLYPTNPITIRFVCGWTTAALVPYSIKASILMRVADQYEQRGEPVVGVAVVTPNKTADRLLQPYRLWDRY